MKARPIKRRSDFDPKNITNSDYILQTGDLVVFGSEHGVRAWGWAGSRLGKLDGWTYAVKSDEIPAFRKKNPKVTVS